MDVEIQIAERSAKTKGEAKRLRRDKQIPVCIYSKVGASNNASIPTVEFETVLRKLQPGFLPTTVFMLKDSKGKIKRAICKDIQYKPTTYEVIHLDFLELHDNIEVDVKVPIELLSQADCVGVKAGGFLRALMRHIKVRCMPSKIPNHFEIDVKELGLNQHRRVSDLVIPSGVTALSKPDDIVVSVLKR